MENQNLIFIVLSLIIIAIIFLLFYILQINSKTKRQNDELKRFIKEEFNFYHNSQSDNNYRMSQSIDDIKTKIAKEMGELELKVQDDFNLFHDRTDKRFNSLETNLHTSLFNSAKSQNELFANINAHMARIDKTQESLAELSKDIVSLETILQDKKARGVFGEIELYSLLEVAYGKDDKLYQRQYKLTNGSIADAVIFLNDEDFFLAIDSKFPLENYRRIYDENEDKFKASKDFKKDIKNHIEAISKKYILDDMTTPMALMFIPAEAIYMEIFNNFTDMVDYAYLKHVYLVSPTSLMAYITAIKNIYIGHRKEKIAKDLLASVSQLAIEFKRFDERVNKLDKDYNNLVEDFDNLKTTSRKIISRFNNINNGKLNEDIKDREDE